MEDGFLTIFYDIPTDSNDCTTGKVLDTYVYNKVMGISEFNYNDEYPSTGEPTCYSKFTNEKVVTIRTDISYLTIIHQSLIVTIQNFVFVLVIANISRMIPRKKS